MMALLDVVDHEQEEVTVDQERAYDSGAAEAEDSTAAPPPPLSPSSPTFNCFDFICIPKLPAEQGN